MVRCGHRRVERQRRSHRHQRIRKRILSPDSHVTATGSYGSVTRMVNARAYTSLRGVAKTLCALHSARSSFIPTPGTIIQAPSPRYIVTHRRNKDCKRGRTKAPGKGTAPHAGGGCALHRSQQGWWGCFSGVPKPVEVPFHNPPVEPDPVHPRRPHSLPRLFQVI